MTLRPARALLLALLRLWLRSLRIEGPTSPPSRGILVLWHEDLPACMAAFSGRGINVLISRSRDGGIAAALCEAMGYRVHRGSSSRGALSGMKTLSRALQGGGLAGMALDGPRGPARVPKAGSLWLAGRCGSPVIPIHVKARRAFRLNTWDRTRIPLPFSKIEVSLGEPVFPESLEELAEMMKGKAHREPALSRDKG